MGTSQIKIKDSVREKLNQYLGLVYQLENTKEKLSYSDILDHALNEAFRNATRKLKKRNEKSETDNN